MKIRESSRVLAKSRCWIKEGIKDQGEERIILLRPALTKLLAIWTSPQLSPEARLWLVDDTARLFLDFGQRTLATAIDWYRQNHSRTSRPTIPEIRGKCSDIASSKKKPISEDIEKYFAELKRNPEEHVPIGLIVRDALALKSLKDERAKQGRPMTPQDREEWRLSRIEQTRQEWREMVRRGEHIPPQSVDVKRSAAGDLEPAFA